MRGGSSALGGGKGHSYACCPQEPRSQAGGEDEPRNRTGEERKTKWTEYHLSPACAFPSSSIPQSHTAEGARVWVEGTATPQRVGEQGFEPKPRAGASQAPAAMLSHITQGWGHLKGCGG